MRLSRIRVGFQVLLHVVLIGHVLAYYWLNWRSVGALDFQSFFHPVLGAGVLTAGALLAIAVYGSALVFGRLFCSWGCHFGATQDLAAWILRRVGWRPPRVRTRFLQWFPYVFLVVIFVLPLLRRWLLEDWEFSVDVAAVAPWDTLPGRLMSVLTFLVCGAAILLFLGTRGFCRFVCPYGALFRVTSRIAPFRVRRIASCAGSPAGSCASAFTTDSGSTLAPPPCTAACPTAIDVHRETSEAGAVTSTDCIRCNLCIEACPQDALAYRARPVPSVTPSEPGISDDSKLAASAATSRPESALSPRSGSPGTPWTLSVGAELLVAIVTLATYAIADLVYGGHFLAASLALAEGFLVYAVLALFRRRGGGRWTFSGVTAVGVLLLTFVPLFEAAAFKLLKYRALRHDPPRAESSLDLARREDGSTEAPEKTSLLKAAELYRRALAYFPRHSETLRLLLSVYLRLHDSRAMEVAEELCGLSYNSHSSRELLYWVYFRYGELERAKRLESSSDLFDP